jgi:hypothetical protein
MNRMWGYLPWRIRALLLIAVTVFGACADVIGTGATGTPCSAGDECATGLCLGNLCPTALPTLNLCVGGNCTGDSCGSGYECVAYGPSEAACVPLDICPAQLAEGASCLAGRECESNVCIAAPCAKDLVREICISRECDDAGECSEGELAWEDSEDGACYCTPGDVCD